MVVFGVGAVLLPVPLVATVYHNKPVPVAVNWLAVVPWQLDTELVTPGADGMALTATAICALGLSQPLVVWLT